MQKFTFFILFIVGLLFSQALMAQVNFRSAASGDWSTLTNWEEELTPGVWTTAATAPPTSTDGVITIRSGHNITVGLSAVTADEVVVAPGGTLTVNNTLTLADGAGVDLLVDGTLNLNNTLAAGAGTPTVEVEGTMDWIGGTLGVNTVNTITGIININTANKTLSAILANDGTINWSASLITFSNGTLNNNATFNATGNDAFVSGAGTNVFNNNVTGTFTKSTGVGTTTFIIPVVNAGTFNLNSGTVSSANATSRFVNTGTLNFNSGSLTLSGTLAGGNQLDAGTVLTGTGNLNIQSVTGINLALAPPSTVTLSLAVGLGANGINGTGSLTVSGIFNWANGRVAIPTTISATGTLNSTGGKDFAANFTNDGTINLTDPVNGSLDFEGITFTNNGTINVNYTGNRFFSSGAGGNSFVNNGVINKTTAITLTVNPGVPITNSGTFQGTGIYLFNGGFTSTGGTVSPGTATSPAILRVNNVIFSAASDVEIEIFDANAPGTGHDQLEISTGGVTTLNGTLTIVDDVALPNAPLGTYTVMTNVGGTFGGTLTLVAPTNYNNLQITATTVTVDKIALFPLPLIWGKFEVLARNNKVELTWNTLEEINTSHFVVEHSTDGREYKPVGTVSASGSSENSVDYSFWHNSPNTGKLNYYRLLQVDLNGKSTYSAIRTVKFNKGKVVALTASPNPVKDQLQLSVQLSDVRVVLNNAAGAALRTYQFNQGVHQVSIDNLPSGVYLLSVYKGNEKIDVVRIVKQ